MLLIDEIISHDKDQLVSRIEIDIDKPFYDPNLPGVPSWVAIEYMAQSIAALSGYSQVATGQEIQLGMLISCRRFAVATAAFHAGETLLATVTELAGADTGMAAYDCSVSRESDEQQLATAILGVYQRTNPEL